MIERKEASAGTELDLAAQAPGRIFVAEIRSGRSHRSGAYFFILSGREM